jgi:ABC-type multidrug transport system fused ATPase/permease subunit
LILSLLLRVYEVLRGHFLLGHVDGKTLSQQFVRSQIAIVSQSPKPISMLILENIKFGNSKSRAEDAVHSAEIGNSHNSILPKATNIIV